MSYATTNKEQNALIEPTPEQMNPGLAKATDFKIGSAVLGHGQHGETRAEYNKLLEEADSDQKTKLGTPVPTRKTIPANAAAIRHD